MAKTHRYIGTIYILNNGQYKGCNNLWWFDSIYISVVQVSYIRRIQVSACTDDSKRMKRYYKQSKL